MPVRLQLSRSAVMRQNPPANRALIHRYIDVYEYPDGRIELRADGLNLAYERWRR